MARARGENERKGRNSSRRYAPAAAAVDPEEVAVEILAAVAGAAGGAQSRETDEIERERGSEGWEGHHVT